MKTVGKIWVSFLILILSGGYVAGQSGSRLNVGATPKNNVTKKSGVSVISPISGKVSADIRVNKNAAINEFYKDLLLTNKPTHTQTGKALSYIIPEKSAEDHLFESEDVNISNIYPNPANDYANLNYRIHATGKHIRISFINILGGSMGDFTLDPSDSKLQVNTRTWDNGIYFYQLMVDGKKVATKKLVVRHH